MLTVRNEKDTIVAEMSLTGMAARFVDLSVNVPGNIIGGTQADRG